MQINSMHSEPSSKLGEPELQKDSSADSVVDISDDLAAPHPKKDASLEAQKDHDASQDASKQLVIYKPEDNLSAQVVESGEAAYDQVRLFNSFSHRERVLPSIGAFTVQCATCLKWRLIPSKELYEAIRGTILVEPFTCERAREWRPDVCCEDPADIIQDDSRIWAIDRPNISQPPPGWERELRIRGEGSTRFADVYYVSPTGKRLRSKVEVQKFLLEHPEYLSAGVHLSQFSYQIPRPLQEGYVRKKLKTSVLPSTDGPYGLPSTVGAATVNPLAWAPASYSVPQVHGEGRPNEYLASELYRQASRKHRLECDAGGLDEHR